MAERSQLQMEPERPIVVNYGAGVNSTALVIGLHERGIRPDHIMFADTGGERPETYEHLERFVVWLARAGFPTLTVVKARRMFPTLEEECLGRNTLPSIVFGFRKCSQQFKIAPQESYCKGWPKYTKAIGFDFGEQHRALRGDTDTPKYRKWFPLIEWKWGRRECIASIERAGLCVPPKSACFFCQSTTKDEVLELARTAPDLFARAVAMEENAAPGLRTIKGLGRHWSWRELVTLDAAQLRLIPDPPPAPCGCAEIGGGDA